MAVFMGTRQNYQLSRFKFHSGFAIISAVCLLAAPCSLFIMREAPTGLLSVVTVTSMALSTKNGRKSSKRLVKESFYGCLFTVTGVFYTNGANRVGN